MKNAKKVNLENLVSYMLKMNVLGRLWHWSTPVATHHLTFESFLTTNETLTDRIVETILGNDGDLNLSQVEVTGVHVSGYSIDKARAEILHYKDHLNEVRREIGSGDQKQLEDLLVIIDDLNELCSKTLYLLKLK